MALHLSNSASVASLYTGRFLRIELSSFSHSIKSVKILLLPSVSRQKNAGLDTFFGSEQGITTSSSLVMGSSSIFKEV